MVAVDPDIDPGARANMLIYEDELERLRNNGNWIEFQTWNIEDLYERVKAGVIAPHSVDHITMEYVVPYWKNRGDLSSRLKIRQATPDLEKLADGFLAVLKPQGGTFLGSQEEVSGLAPKLYERDVPFVIVPLNYLAKGTTTFMYLIVLGDDPFPHLTLYARHCAAWNYLRYYRELAEGKRPATLFMPVVTDDRLMARVRQGVKALLDSIAERAPEVCSKASLDEMRKISASDARKGAATGLAVTGRGRGSPAAQPESLDPRASDEVSHAL